MQCHYHCFNIVLVEKLSNLVGTNVSILSSKKLMTYMTLCIIVFFNKNSFVMYNITTISLCRYFFVQSGSYAMSATMTWPTKRWKCLLTIKLRILPMLALPNHDPGQDSRAALRSLKCYIDVRNRSRIYYHIYPFPH